ncbi:MAG: cobyric acid synthase, partial [Proteobacteria bacterium]|nr:cobyric acid synthase [Pseudomonadota bacterium]
MNTTKGICLSILGTGSDVGKSIVVTALCRIFRNQGVRVAPFKAQNMSNNSFITLDGGEMGRAQVVQAEAAGLEPHVDMNPILLKPNSDIGSQVIVQGEVYGNRSAQDYFKSTDHLFEKSLESLERLRSQYDLILMEGAGSCGEVNLKTRDFVNFKIARAVNAPVILVADINRGGVFAQIVGTLEVISPEEKDVVCGTIINRFRGVAKLFDEGIQYLESKTQKPVLGLIPHFNNIKIDSEDGVVLDEMTDLNPVINRD